MVMDHEIFVIVLFSLFIIKHFLCDFVFQSQKMVTEKGTYGLVGGIQHSLIHALGTTILLFLVLPWRIDAHLAAIILGILDGVIHYHIDWIKSKINIRFNWHPEFNKGFWVLMGADQALHYLTYVLIIVILVTV